jgi:rare lipoprotein A
MPSTTTGPVVVPQAAVVPVATLPSGEARDETPSLVAPEQAAPSPDAPLQRVASIAPPAAAGAVTATATAPRGFWVQLGAFRESAGAESFQRRVGDEVEWLVPLLGTYGDASLYRVQAGPYASRADAQGAAARVREALGLVPVIVERR